jgi:hypothetical protein
VRFGSRRRKLEKTKAHVPPVCFVLFLDADAKISSVFRAPLGHTDSKRKWRQVDIHISTIGSGSCSLLLVVFRAGSVSKWVERYRLVPCVGVKARQGSWASVRFIHTQTFTAARSLAHLPGSPHLRKEVSLPPPLHWARLSLILSVRVLSCFRFRGHHGGRRPDEER